MSEFQTRRWEKPGRFIAERPKVPRSGPWAGQHPSPGFMLLLRPRGRKLLLQFLPHALIHLLELFQSVCAGRDDRLMSPYTCPCPQKSVLCCLRPRQWGCTEKQLGLWSVPEGYCPRPQPHGCVLLLQSTCTRKDMADFFPTYCPECSCPPGPRTKRWPQLSS